MRKPLLIALSILAILMLGAFIFWKFYWNKDHRTAENEKPVAELSANDLYSSYETNEANSNTLYLNKTIQVSGTVLEQNSEPNGTIVVLLQTESMMGTVSCSFSPEDGKPANIQLAPETPVKLKGICTGFNSVDVVMEQCSIIK